MHDVWHVDGSAGIMLCAATVVKRADPVRYPTRCAVAWLVGSLTRRGAWCRSVSLDRIWGVALAELQERLDLAVDLARRAGASTLRYFRSADLVVDRKADDSPVTRADREAEELIREALDAACPGDAVVGEELGSKEGSTGYRWYVDPIDGTESFVRGVPLFGTMIALAHADEPVAGAIVFPALGELVYAGNGLGTWFATGVHAVGEPIAPMAAHVSEVASLDDAAVSITGFDTFAEAGVTAALARLAARRGPTRGWSDCYGHYLVATGRVDAMIDPVMSVWDNAPLQPIIQEAGGRFTDLRGQVTVHGGSAVSINGLLHDAVLRLLDAGMPA